MAYTTFTAGAVLTAAQLNANLRDQVVTPFATTGARDAAITSPVKGMLEYITSNDSSEGLTSYNSASQWRKPWNMPWGYVGYATATSNQSSITTETDITSLTLTFTAVANRYYEISTQVNWQTAVANDVVQLKIYDATASASLQGTLRIIGNTAANGGYDTLSAQVVTTFSAGSRTVKIRAALNSGTGPLNTYGAATNANFIYIKDVGPSGAPS